MVALSGPPRVITMMWSTVRNALITALISTNSVVGISRGNCTRRKNVQREAPSSAAASASEGDGDWDGAEGEQQVVPKRLPEHRVADDDLVVVETDVARRTARPRRRVKAVDERCERRPMGEQREQGHGWEKEQPALDGGG